MGVNGIATTTTAAGDAAAAVKAMAAMTLEPATASSATAGNDCDLTDEPLGRRRTSIPSSFTYGDSTSTNANDANANAPTSEERRWRSFDCNGSSLTGAKAASLDVLKCRIQQEQTRVQQHSDRLRPRKRTALFRSFARVFSSSHKEQIELRRMEMVAHVAKANRSLVILRDMQTIVLTMDDESVPETPRSSLTADASVQRMLDGIADADQVLAEDSLHHILELQTQFLQKSVDMHGDKRFHVPRVHGVAPSVVLQQFLAEFGRCDGMRRVPCVLDTPTPALVKFEKLLTRYRLIKPQVKQSLDQLCRDTMSSFTRTGAVDLGAASVWETRDRRDVLQSLVRELEETILEAAWVAEAYQTTLRTFIEQLVFSRLAGACYQSLSVELDEKNSLWRDQIAKARELQLQDVGLPVEIPEPVVDATPWFARSIEAFNRIPHLIPSCVMAAFLSAIRVLYEETNKLFGLTCPCISADVLLPLLVFVLSRTDLPHLHSQVYLMENFAIDESHEGSEAAYYLACLQAAMGYIMTEIDKKHD